ncbi:hypothetical protein GCM10007390_39920 [Persicitalea jodogahamensis]|uniref:Uncharacterized protein n=1 Tax=Persicitalea jodogahamensis TaxID=402147 RepID=A0A8J3GBE2_9BACT|nr:hypothetical protein GCM10007390_39920 [Persicitalea jodogahamensis]
MLKTIVWGQETDSIAEKFKLLVQQHNEHRILIPRLFTWLNYQLEGHIDWPVLMVFGNLLWCTVLYFLWDAFRTLKLSLWYFLPVPWLLFQPAYYDNYNWSISVLQQSVIVFLLAWLVYSFVNRRFLLAIFIFLIGTFTHGNGIFGVAVGVAFLVLYKEWKWLWIWLAVCLSTAVFYFYGFEKGQNADFLQSLTHPVQMFGYFFAFFGSAAEVLGVGFVPSVSLGILVFGGIAWYGIPRVYAHYRFNVSLSYFDKLLLGNLLFLSITALLVAVSRSWSSPDLDIPPRYAHYSPYLTAWFYLVGLAVFYRLAAKGWAISWSIGAVLFNLVSHLNYVSDLEYRRDWLTADYVNWLNYQTFLEYQPSFNHNIRDVYSSALARGICRPTLSLPASTTLRTAMDSSIVLGVELVENPTADASGKTFEKEIVFVDKNFSGEIPFLCLIPEAGPAMMVPFYRGRNGYRKMLTEQRLRKPEISTRFFSDNLPSGTYRIGYQFRDSLLMSRYRLNIDNERSIKLL